MMMSTDEQATQTIFLFMDVLGASDILKNRQDKVTLLEEIVDSFANGNREHDVKYKDTEDGYRDMLNFQPKISSHSDYITASYPEGEIYPCGSHTEALVVMSLVGLAAQIHAFALARGFLMRGGIARGKQGKRIGIAQVLAVELEKKARYPRVIIAEDLISIFTKHTPSDLLRIDGYDGQYFIDYLRHYPSMFGNGLTINAEFVKDLLKVREIIERELLSIRRLSHVRGVENWEWVARKFNESIEHARSRFKSIHAELLQIEMFSV